MKTVAGGGVNLKTWNIKPKVYWKHLTQCSRALINTNSTDTQSSSPPSVLTCGAKHLGVSFHFFFSSIRWLVSPLPHFSNEEAFDPNIWFLDHIVGMAVCALHHGNGLLENQPNRRARWFVHYQGGLVLVQPVEGLLHGLHSRHQLQRLRGPLECPL